MSSLKTNTSGIYDIPSANIGTLYIRGKKFQEYLDEVGSGLTAAELVEVKSLLEYLDITGLNSAWTVANNNVNETLRSAITALQTKLLNIDTTALSSPSILNDANKNSALKTAIDTLITDLTALTNRVTTEETNVDNLQTKTAFLDTTALTQTSVLTNDNRNSVLKTAIDALSGTPGDVTALAARVTTAEGDIDSLEGRATSLEGRATSLEGRATSLEGRATAVEGRATTLEGKTRFTTVSNTYFDNNIGTAQPFGIPFGDFDGSTYPIGSFKMEVGPTLNQAGEGKSYFEITHKNLVQNPNFPAGDVAQAQFSNLLRCAGIRSYYRKGATPGIYNLSNETFLQHTDENGDGRVTVKAKVMRILPPDTNSIVEIGRFGESWSNPDIRIGSRGCQLNLCSMEDDELAQGVGDVATKTRIYIGRRPTTGNAGDVLNSQLILQGDCFTGNLNFKDLTLTAPLSIETLIAFLSPNGLPSFIFSSLFGGGLSLPKSDVVVMKGTLTKRGDIETSNNLSIEKLSIINTSVGNLTPGFTMFFAQHDVTCTQLIGNHRTGVFVGEISMKNYNTASTGVDFVSAEENDLVNVLSIKGDSGILLHQGASSNMETLDIFNSKNGAIRLFIGGDGTRAGTTYGGIRVDRYLEPGNLVATGESKIFMGSRLAIDSAIASDANQGDGFGQGKVSTDAQLVIEPSTKVDTTRRQGINVRHKTIVNNLPVYTQSIINSDSISTPSVEADSLKITNNYGGSTTQRLYKDANNKLYWNGEQISAVNYPLLAPTNQNVSNTYIDSNSNLYGNSDAGFPKQSALPTTYTGTIRTASTGAELISAIASAVDYDIIRITANITLTFEQTISKKLKIEGTSNAIVTTYNTGGNIFTITSSEVWFSALTFSNANSFSNANILNFSSSSAIKNYVSGCIFQTNEFAISSNNNNIQITDNIFEFVGSADSHRYIYLTGCLGSCFINNNTFRGNSGASTQCVFIANAVASAFQNGKIIISGNVSATNPVQRLLMVEMALTASNVSFYVSRNVMTTTSGFIILYVSPFDGIKEFYVVQNTETLGSGITGGKGIIGIDSASSSVISFNTIVYSSGNSPAVLRADYTNLVNSSANQNGVIAYATARFTPGATTYSVIVPFIVNIDPNVKEITAGTNISVTPNAGNYTIANTAPVQNVVAGSGGISVDYNGTTATISVVSIGGGGGGGGGAGSQSSRDEEEALLEIAAQPRKPNYWSQNWSIVDSEQRIHNDVYCSVDGKIIVSCSNFIRRSTDYGITWSNFNSVQSIGQNMEWKTITGTSNGEKLFALIFNEDTGDRRIYESIDRGGSWTILHTLPAGITPNRMRCSGDGRYIVLDDTSTKSNGAHYSSSDFGVTFIVRILQSGIGNGSTNGLCMSRSGAIQYMIFRGDFESIIYRSFNYGVTWSVGLYIPRFDDNNVDKGYLTSLECCALGKFLYAPRFVAFNTATTTGYRSNNYGANWNETGLGTATNFWVSGTGQFVVATSIPVGVPVVGSVNVFYSTDYGLSYASVSLGVPTSSSIAGSANGEILVIVSKSITENTFTGDGKIRLFRQGEIDEIYTSYPDPISGQQLTTNSRLALAPAVQLWATTDYRPSNTNIYFINFFPNKIDMRYYNIQYEFEFFWERGGATYPQTFLNLGLNSLYAANASAQTSTRKSSATSWTFESPKFSTQGTPYNLPQNFVDRFYAGFAPLSPDNLLNEYRMRTILKGELSLNFRSIGDVAFNSGQADNSINSRVINNNFSCTSYTIEYNTPTQWGIFHQNDDGIQYSQQTINGNAVWNASLGGVWTSGSANERMDNGIHQLFIASTNTVYGSQVRPCQVKARVFRVRK